MSLKKKKHEHIRNAYLKEVLLALDDFLDVHWTFRREECYKGWFGRLSADADWKNSEELDRRLGEEHLWSPEVQGSSPDGYALAVREAQEWHREHNFSMSLMRLIEARGLDPVTVYKRANIDRKLFSKIRTNIDYLPGKKTVLALALALELSLEETQELLRLCGFALSPDILSDVIVRFFLVRGKYDLDEVNAALYAYDQPVF